MENSTQPWRLLARPGRHQLPTWAAVALSSFLLVGCLGGQTGTEAAPTDKATRESGGSGGQAVPSAGGEDSGLASTPPRASAPGCDAESQPGTAFEEQTGMSEVAITDFLSATNPIQVQYGDGSVTMASLEVTPTSDSCVTITPSGPTTLRVPVDIALTSDDGRIELVFSGNAEAKAATGGGVGVVNVRASVRCENLGDPGTLAACAIVGIDLTPFSSIAVDLEFGAQSNASTMHLLGDLRLSAVDPANCQSTPCGDMDWVVVTEALISH